MKQSQSLYISSTNVSWNFIDHFSNVRPSVWFHVVLTIEYRKINIDLDTGIILRRISFTIDHIGILFHNLFKNNLYTSKMESCPSVCLVTERGNTKANKSIEFNFYTGSYKLSNQRRYTNATYNFINNFSNVHSF